MAASFLLVLLSVYILLLLSAIVAFDILPLEYVCEFMLMVVV